MHLSITKRLVNVNVKPHRTFASTPSLLITDILNVVVGAPNSLFALHINSGIIRAVPAIALRKSALKGTFKTTLLVNARGTTSVSRESVVLVISGIKKNAIAFLFVTYLSPVLEIKYGIHSAEVANAVLLLSANKALLLTKSAVNANARECVSLR